jgi:phosphoglucosamine mutase
MISASHNPMPDNGIKFFDSDGYKLADSAEDAIEASCGKPRARPTGADVGRVCDDSGAVEAYLDYLLKQLPHSLQGLHVVVDCANGAASTLAPELFRRAGATVHAVSAEPTGLNINDGCGSTQPGGLAAEVVGRGADAGIALDGDADRCIAVDASGEIVDGDAILAICALRLQESGLLSGDTVVTTVMTNLGFCQAMQRAGIAVVQTPVGDRYVLEEMRRRGAALGGEQSGHLIFLHQATTGDGLLTALHLLVRMAATSKSLRELAAVMRRLPQVLVNVPTADRERVLAAPAVAAAVRRAEQRLAGAGRVLVRPSGTEPVVRVMVEAPSEAEAAAVAADVAAAFPG